MLERKQYIYNVIILITSNVTKFFLIHVAYSQLKIKSQLIGKKKIGVWYIFSGLVCTSNCKQTTFILGLSLKVDQMKWISNINITLFSYWAIHNGLIEDPDAICLFFPSYSGMPIEFWSYQIFKRHSKKTKMLFLKILRKNK